MYPTVLDIVGVTMKHQLVIDGISLLPLFEGRMDRRPKPLGFAAGRYAREGDPESCQILNSSWIDGRHMLRIDPPTKQRKTESVTLYDIMADPGQEKNLSDGHPQEVQRMLKDLAPWHESVKASFAGKDYLR
jgi:arylsulfatase A-like enzyme